MSLIRRRAKSLLSERLQTDSPVRRSSLPTYSTGRGNDIELVTQPILATALSSNAFTLAGHGEQPSSGRPPPSMPPSLIPTTATYTQDERAEPEEGPALRLRGGAEDARTPSCYDCMAFIGQTNCGLAGLYTAYTNWLHVRDCVDKCLCNLFGGGD
ncbi:hypothetical protein H0H92_009014 [Tricholoma furcatifolium]|nr:hypothetical protein H0H92_009014 [Tricholoma furcatifolium]